MTAETLWAELIESSPALSVLSEPTVQLLIVASIVAGCFISYALKEFTAKNQKIKGSIQKEEVKMNINTICEDCQFVYRCGCIDDEHEYKLEECSHYALALYCQKLLTEQKATKRKSFQVKIRRCRVCGCSQMNGCFEGCSWAEKHLCSKCAERKLK